MPALPRRTDYFSGKGDAYTGRQLFIHDRLTGSSSLVARADPYVRPVWSLDRTRLLYVRVRPVSAFPGARWSLLVYDMRSRRSRVLADATGMDLSPLGWLDGAPLYSLARETETSIYRVVGGRSHFISIMSTQPVTGPVLSPGGRFIAFVTPADCYWCSLYLFDVRALDSWYGPNGIPSKYSIAWTADGDAVVTMIGKNLAAIDAGSHHVRLYRRPSALPMVWNDPMIAEIDSDSIHLVDVITGRSFVARAT